MLSVRVLADDLTGALDAGAEFAGVATMEAFWHGGLPAHLPESAALDSGTRELEAAAAVAISAGFAPALAAGGIAFKKVDSLMRGPTLAEVAACFAGGPWRAAVFAPAFPYQGRITRAGRQYVRSAAGEWVAAGPDLVAGLRAAGVPAQRGRLGAVPPGISVFDAASDADLDAIVAGVGRSQPVLWCGTGGLARALAGSDAAQASAMLPRPVLGLFGSDQAATAAQLAACGPVWLRLPDAGAASTARLRRQLDADGVAMVSLDLPAGLPRDDAAARIAATFAALCAQVQKPGTMLVAGGETLRGLCLALGARSLGLVGRIEPGLPRAVLRGGVWDGVAVVSKSGAFGSPFMLSDLLGLQRTL
ncbi:MAG: four-carbon acid sugar kinase family protein [Acetobacteraceae bacterium]